MITKQEHSGNIRIEEYSLAAWLAEVETVINQGYTFNFESNDTHPQVFGSMYTVLMVPVIAKENKSAVAPSDTPTEPLVETPVAEVTVESPQTKRKYNKG